MKLRELPELCEYQHPSYVYQKQHKSAQHTQTHTDKGENEDCFQFQRTDLASFHPHPPF